VAPNLRQPILVNGQADAAAGHLFTISVGLRALNVADDDVTTFPYADWGVRVFGNSVVVKKKWAEDHPEAMRAFVKCAVDGIKRSIQDPKQSIAWLRKYNSLMVPEVELRGLDFSNRVSIITEESKKDGISTFSRERLDQVLTQVSSALNIKKPAEDDIWTARYLPSADELKLPLESTAQGSP
jgi:NitT/TauT family transport system substrate-binding protein